MINWLKDKVTYAVKIYTIRPRSLSSRILTWHLTICARAHAGPWCYHQHHHHLHRAERAHSRLPYLGVWLKYERDTIALQQKISSRKIIRYLSERTLIMCTKFHNFSLWWKVLMCFYNALKFDLSDNLMNFVMFIRPYIRQTNCYNIWFTPCKRYHKRDSSICIFHVLLSWFTETLKNQFVFALL